MKRICGLAVLLACLIVCGKNVVDVFASAGGDGVDMSLDSCNSGTCYNGTVWVHYTYKRKAVTVVGKDWGPFYDLISTRLDGYNDSLNGTNGTSIPTDCYDHGGFWHLEHVLSSIAFKERTWAFGNSGVGYAYQAAGVRTDVTQAYDYDTAEDLGNDNHADWGYGQYDSSVVTPHYYSWATMANVKTIYKTYYDTDKSVVSNIKPGTFFNKNSNYTYFCGSAEPPTIPEDTPDPGDDEPDEPPKEPEDEYAVAEVDPKANIKANSPGESGYTVSGGIKYTALDTGTKSFATEHSIVRVTTQEKKNPKFQTRQSYYNNGAWSAWSATSLRKIDDKAAGAELGPWAGTAQSVSVDYDDKFHTVCARTQSWDSYYKVGEESNILEYTGKQTVKDCLYVRGPRTKRAEVTGDIELTVTDGSGGNSMKCTAANCKYYANSNNLTFKVSAKYVLERESDGGPAFNFKYAKNYSSSGSVIIPSLGSSSLNLSPGGSNSSNSSTYTLYLSYNENKKVCFNMGYQSSVKYNYTKLNAGKGLQVIEYDEDSASTCVTIYAPREKGATFSLSGLSSSLDSDISDIVSETRSADNKVYKVGKGSGLKSTYSIGEGTFKIERTDSNTDPETASSQYVTQFRTGAYNSSYPTYTAASKLSSGLLSAGAKTPDLMVGGGDHTISVPIGTEKSSAYNYAFCNYGRYDTNVGYIVYWAKTNGKANSDGVKKISVAKSGGRDFSGTAYKCYALYNPSVTYTASFSGESDGHFKLLANLSKVPGLIMNYDRNVGKLDNAERITEGDDAGRYKYKFSSTVSYEAVFTHTIKLSNEALPGETSVISPWLKDGGTNVYSSLPFNTEYKIKVSDNGTDYRDYVSGTSGVFSESVKSVLVSENDVFFTFTSTMTPSWGIGKYWNYCQKLYWRKSKTFTSKPRNTSGAVNIPGKEYSVLATTGDWTTDAEATVACVILKNPKWEEEDDSTTLSHKIQAKGYATQVGANNPGSNDYTTGVEGTIECSSNYLGVVGGSCALNQLNVLSQNVSAYFGHTIRRYDNGAFGSDRINYDSSLFDESKSGVSEGSNFWKDACLRTTVDGECEKTSGSRFATNQKNSMYAYAGMNNSELASIGLDYDPFSISVEYKGNQKIGENLWVSELLNPYNAPGWRSVDYRLRSRWLGDELSVWDSSMNLDDLRGMTYQKFVLGDIRAGELMKVCNATATKPSEWTVNYAKVNRRAVYTVNGTGSLLPSDFSENEAFAFDRYELRSSHAEVSNINSYGSETGRFFVDGRTRYGNDCLNLKRDWNYDIKSASLSNNSLEDSIPTMNSGEGVGGTFNLTVVRDNVPEGENDSKGWVAVDGGERDFITDVSSDRTKISLVLYSVLPYSEVSGVDSSAYNTMFNNVINGGTVAGSSVGDRNYCNFFRNGFSDTLAECVDVGSVGSRPEKWSRVSGSLTGDDWGYWSGVGERNGEYGLTVSASDIEHVDLGSGCQGFACGADITSKNVSAATKYYLGVNVPQMKSFKMTSGAKFCVALAIEKKSSTSDYVLISESNCKNVVKNPQFSVWGGDVASNGGITTTFVKGDGVLSGSWGDFGLIAGRAINAMSSGRGFPNAPEDMVVDSGKELRGFSEMTIANRNDSYGNSGVQGLEQNLQAGGTNGLWARLKNGGTGGGVCVSDYGDSESTVTEMKAGDIVGILSGCGEKRVVIHSGGTIKIKDDIILGVGAGGLGLTDTSLTKIADVPQVIIVAKNIFIKENVTRIDAWLVSTGGEINTCQYKDEGAGTIKLGVGLADNNADVLNGDARNISKRDCWQFLQVNGPVVGGKILFRRTKGGDGRDNLNYADGSVIDAPVSTLDSTTGEISENVDFIPGALLFSISESSDSVPKVVYNRELAPRY